LEAKNYDLYKRAVQLEVADVAEIFAKNFEEDSLKSDFSGSDPDVTFD
jgi:hypothetical protein